MPFAPASVQTPGQCLESNWAVGQPRCLLLTSLGSLELFLTGGSLNLSPSFENTNSLPIPSWAQVVSARLTFSPMATLRHVTASPGPNRRLVQPKNPRSQQMTAASPSITYSYLQGKLQVIISAYNVGHQANVARERLINAQSVAVPSENLAAHCLHYLLVQCRSGLKVLGVVRNLWAQKGCPPSPTIFSTRHGFCPRC